MKNAYRIFCIIIVLLLCSSVTALGSSPVPKDRSYYEKHGDILWEVHTSQKVISLTFDDGPDPTETEQILDVLKKYQAKSTFFAIGQRIHSFPEVAKRVAAEGHEIANHTYNHVYFKKPINQNQALQEIERTEREIIRITGKRSGLFRPPGGMYDETLVNISNNMGLKPVLWSWHQDTKDWSRPGVYEISNRVIRNAKNGDIVLFHDHVYGQSQTVQALNIILPVLKKKGFHFVTVTELMKLSDERKQIKPSHIFYRSRPRIGNF